ncbi:ABC transporter ATP-binding protein [Diaphorobacter sp. HDW4A]|uniref:ABC transporter ATP-binding protein n=1 Tax=Diaphorobacter sp. HDW4A TaxID=2714924 RepID=UPI00140BB1F0|nr:ABC transporter ATP-binding protein [Diaphorobacter sp. HDW4A]QIL79724.1 ABC transporter ATP-binding protein [Diaphorobacter sp. HDW4A]
MSSDLAIRIEQLSKCYQIYAQPRDRLKQMLLPKLQRLTGQQPKRYYEEFWALRNISFEIRKGEAVGIVGRNGSGKSTLLQLICGTLTPTLGTVETKGRIAALLELGSGFNPEFTGRENVYLNGAILGIDEEQMNAVFERIVKFADIGDHLDQPVKTYSSGMFVRLAFAVQMHLDPEILIVDEALSVGDQFFQAKCYAAIRTMMDKGTTVLFVSHSAATVKALCPRAVLLSHGDLIVDGPASKVLDRYFVLGSLEANAGNASQPDVATGQADTPAAATISSAAQPASQVVSQLQPPFDRRVSHRVGSGQAQFVECRVLADSDEAIVVETGSTLRVQAVLDVREDCPQEGEVGLVVSTTEGVELFAINSFFSGARIPAMKAGEKRVLEFEFISPLSSGARYRIDLGYRMPVQGEYVDKVFAAAGFSVVNQGDRIIPLLFDVPGKITIA